MSQYYRRFPVEILTPRERVLSGQAVSVVFPAADGQKGVLAGHAPLAAALGIGMLVVEDAGAGPKRFFIAGGFARFHDNSLILLADECLPVEKLDAGAALAALEAAQRLPDDTIGAANERRRAVHYARCRLNIAEECRDAAMTERYAGPGGNAG